MTASPTTPTSPSTLKAPGGASSRSHGPQRHASTSSLASLASSCDTELVEHPRPVVSVSPAKSAAGLGEIRKECIARGQDPEFLKGLLDSRCKQLFPRDLLVATVPTAGGGKRIVGMLRRTQRFLKEERRSMIVVDFVYVLRSHRGLGIGRQLLVEGMLSGKKPKPCSLLVAGSENNVVAVKLYESLGFRWASALRTEMRAPDSAVARLMEMRAPLTPPSGGDEADAPAADEQPAAAACAPRLAAASADSSTAADAACLPEVAAAS